MFGKHNNALNEATSVFAQLASHPHLHAGMVALFAVIYFLIRSQFFAIPMGWDEGIYTYFGQLILDGKVPYVDFYDHRFPGIFYMYALLAGLFGPFKGLACGITLLNIGSMLFIFRIARNWFDKTAGLVAVVAFGLLTLAPEIAGYTRQSEHMVVFWAMGGLYFVQKGLRSGQRHNFFLAGIFMCLSMLIKPNGVFFIILGGLWSAGYDLLKKNEPQRVRKFLINGAAYSVGVFCAFGALCVFMLTQGVLDDMWYWAVTYAAGYVSGISFAQGRQYFFDYFFPFFENYWPFWILAGIGLLTYPLVRKEKDALSKKAALLATAVMCAMTIVPGFYFFEHYWIMLVPGLAFAIAAAVYAVPRLVPAPAGKAKRELVAVLGLLAVIHFVQLRHYYISPDYTAVLRRTFGDGQPFSVLKVIGEYVRRIKNPGDQIALWGESFGELYIYTDCRSATRHAYFSYLTDVPETSDVLIRQKEYANEIEANQPRFVFVIPRPLSMFTHQPSDLKIFEWFKLYTEHYHPIGIADYDGRNQPLYIWDEKALTTYIPRHTFQVWILERNEDSLKRTGHPRP